MILGKYLNLVVKLLFGVVVLAVGVYMRGERREKRRKEYAHLSWPRYMLIQVMWSLIVLGVLAVLYVLLVVVAKTANVFWEEGLLL